MAEHPPPVKVPDKRTPLDELVERFPVLRQSDLATFDDCALRSYFEQRYSNGWTTHPQARGTIFHRVAAECLRTMKEQDHQTISPADALVILEEQLEQRGMPAHERVRVPMRQIPELRMAVKKFARDNSFSVRHIVDVEKRLEHPLEYADDDGVKRVRRISGQLDALIADPKDKKMETAIILDWKDTWGLPGGKKVPDGDDAGKNLSYHGFFQLRLYGWLVMMNYPAVQKVILREFYPRYGKPRTATLTRKQLPEAERMIRVVVLDFDRALSAGKPKKLKTPEDAEPWGPSPGQHCYWCLGKHRCPIPPEVRIRAGAPATEDEARRMVGELEVAEAIKDGHRKALKPYVAENPPVPSKRSKGRRVFGMRQTKGGPTMTFFTPEGTDRGVTREPVDRKLEEAMKRSVKAARAERDREAEKAA